MSRIRYAYLGSGSRGNAAVIEYGDTRVMLDCGFSLKETERRLARLDLAAADIDALLVTHEHSDHIAGVGRFARRYGLPVWLTDGTRASGRAGDMPDARQVVPSREIRIGPLAVAPVAVPHDAREPVQYVFTAGCQRLGILTDLGHITPHVLSHFSACDALVVECNHDPSMLAGGPYPPALKARVGGRYGHLNNGQAAGLLDRVERDRLQHVLAVHISDKNNTRALAIDALTAALAGGGADVTAACQDDGTPWREIL